MKFWPSDMVSLTADAASFISLYLVWYLRLDAKKRQNEYERRFRRPDQINQLETTIAGLYVPADDASSSDLAHNIGTIKAKIEVFKREMPGHQRLLIQITNRIEVFNDEPTNVKLYDLQTDLYELIEMLKDDTEKAHWSILQ